MNIHLLSIALAATGASLFASLLIVFSEGWHGQHSLDSDLDGVQKFHTTAVPRIGGLAVVIAIVLTLLLSKFFVPGLLSQEYLLSASFLLLAGLPAFFAGMIEDLTKKVSVKARLLASLLSAVVASWLLGATVVQLNIWGLDTLLTWGPFALLVTAIVVAGGVNAVNIIDGFNGLAASTVVIMLAALGVVSLGIGDMLVAQLAMLGLGAAIGFLIVNYPTGRLFLGDGGAYFLGFWVAEVAVLLLVRNPSINAWQMLSICAYPVIEVLYSIYRRKFLRQSSPGAPDGLHLHTLVYRRLVSRVMSLNKGQPWIRNALVACLMVPFVAAAACLSVIVGHTFIGAILIVVGQVLFYMVIYARLVRGSWYARSAATVATPEKVNLETRQERTAVPAGSWRIAERPVDVETMR